MNKIATISIVLATLIIAGAFLAYAQVQKKDTAQEKTATCPCGCGGNCGGDCGNPDCTCAKTATTAGGSCSANTVDSCTGETGCDGSCGGTCGKASCGCGA